VCYADADVVANRETTALRQRDRRLGQVPAGQDDGGKVAPTQRPTRHRENAQHARLCFVECGETRIDDQLFGNKWITA